MMFFKIRVLKQLFATSLNLMWNHYNRIMKKIIYNYSVLPFIEFQTIQVNKKYYLKICKSPTILIININYYKWKKNSKKGIYK